MTDNIILELCNISKSYDDTPALVNINLYIRRNEFVTLLGPSGCGKTTTLRIIGGFEEADSGDLLFEGKNINYLPAYKRKVNTVFQKYALFPHMNVFDNIAFGLKIKKMDKQTIKEKVERMLKLVNLEGYGKRSVNSLSGGQQQRVAIARALVNEPEVLLLDEPLGALDLKLRKEMQVELKKMQQTLGITFIYVTHDQEEALSMSDTIVVMNNGVIQQIGTPEDIYNEPKNAFVADFIGESNIIDGIMVRDYQVSFAGKAFTCVDKGFKEMENVDVVIRPEDIKVVPAGEGMLEGIVRSATFKGVHYEMMIEGAGYIWMVHSTVLAPVDSEVGMNILPNDIHIMKKSTTQASPDPGIKDEKARGIS
ncbi:MAG TPA: ABC transporter ATP-binding protein [Clostridiales bacterium]|nr:ABC transporter ATP-binding protein [Clostridiales bacterium]